MTFHFILQLVQQITISTLQVLLGCPYAFPVLQTVSLEEAMLSRAHATVALVELMKVMSHCPAWVSI